MQFCSDYSNDLDAAFDSLPRNRSDDPTRNPPVPNIQPPARARGNSPSPSFQVIKEQPSGTTAACKRHHGIASSAGKELSTLLLSLRKLREAILATSSKTTVAFSQQVHIFCIRTGLLAQHPPSYYPPLERLLKDLHTPSDPLSESDLHEFTRYLILDYACRQGNMQAAFSCRTVSKAKFHFQSSTVDRVLSSLMHDNWVLFWKAHAEVDGYTRSLMDWASDFVRRKALKAIAKAYLMVDVNYIIQCCTGKEGGCTWEQLVDQEGLGWKREGNKIIIRARRANTDSKRDLLVR